MGHVISPVDHYLYIFNDFHRVCPYIREVSILVHIRVESVRVDITVEHADIEFEIISHLKIHC